MSKIKAIVKRPDEKIGHMTFISNTLENLQKTVGGYIEAVTFGDMVILCDEEGRIKKKESIGTIIAVGSNGEEFSDVPIDMTGWKFLVK